MLIFFCEVVVPKVSVVMPVYNTNPEFLRQTIDSILNQSFRDFEFLIINDASTTNVKDVILSYNDKRIVYVENEQNLGISKTSNKALQLAKGLYIARQDHDDISEPDRLMKQVRVLDENPEIGVCGCFFKVFPKIQKVKLPVTDEAIKIRMITEGAGICHPASLFRKNLLIDNKIIYHDEYRYAEDYQLWIDLLDKTKFYNIPEYLFRYRWFGGNASITAADKQAESAFKIRLNAFRKILPNLDDKMINLLAQVYKNKKFRLSKDEFAQLFPALKQGHQQASEKWIKIAVRKIFSRVLKQTQGSNLVFRIKNKLKFF